MKICKKCNIEYSDDKNFCLSCGSSLDNMFALKTAGSVKKEVLEERLESDPLNIELLKEHASLLLSLKLFKASIKASLKILTINENDFVAKKTLLDVSLKLPEYNVAEFIGKQCLLDEPNEISHLKKLTSLLIKKQ